MWSPKKSVKDDDERPKDEMKEIDVEIEPKDDDGDMDDQLNHMVAEELLSAIEKKDKKGILEAMKALVMNCGGEVK